MATKRWDKWEMPEIEHLKPTAYGWMVSHPDHLELGHFTDIGAFTYIAAHCGVRIEEWVQVGSHCAIYSHDTERGKEGPVILMRGCKIGTHATIMPGVTVGQCARVRAGSVVTRNVPAGELWGGIPARRISWLGRLASSVARWLGV